MQTQLKSFRIEKENLEFIENMKDIMERKSLNETLNILLFFIKDDVKFINSKKEKYSFLKTKNINLSEKNSKEIKIFLTDKEYESLKNIAKQNGFYTVNKFIKLGLLNYLYDEKFLSTATLNEFAKTNHLIKRIGINLNIFVRSIQQDSSAYFVKDDLLELIRQIKNQIKVTDDFIQKQNIILRAKLK